jgi:hypothetical protein
MKPENYLGKRLKTFATWDTLWSRFATSKARILIEQEVCMYEDNDERV